MTVKNYLVSAVRPIRNGWHMEKNQDLYKAYGEMYQMRLASFRKFCQEPFEAVLWTEPTDDCDTYTESNWTAIKELWDKEPCNVFWAGADTFMIKPTSVFGDRYKEYRLFNYTDPRAHREFEHHFNDDVQYYPHTMSKEIWALGEKYFEQRETHPDRHWGFDQLRHNAMFWAQDIPDNDRVHPEMNYMCHNLRSDHPAELEATRLWNSGLPLNDANILHFAASRGSRQVVNMMKVLCQELGIDYE
jgi:hypothetical protein